MFRNKENEEGKVVTNKSRIVAQGYLQEEDIDFEEFFAPVARLKAIKILCVYACYKNFKLFQIDVKSAFLNGYIKEEVYVEQPPEFVDRKYPNYVFKLKKALYGLRQAPRAWYDKLSQFPLNNGFSRSKVDNTLFTLHKNDELLLIQIYVDDIIFDATNEFLCDEFSKLCKRSLK